MCCGFDDLGWLLFSFNMSFLFRKVEDVTTLSWISKSQSLTSVSIKTAPWEFQTKLLHYFFTSNNKSNLHFTVFRYCHPHLFLYFLSIPPPILCLSNHHITCLCCPFLFFISLPSYFVNHSLVYITYADEVTRLMRLVRCARHGIARVISFYSALGGTKRGGNAAPNSALN